MATPAVRSSSLSSARSSFCGEAAMQKARCLARPASAAGRSGTRVVRPLRERSKTFHSRVPARPPAAGRSGTRPCGRCESAPRPSILESRAVPVAPAPSETELAERLAARTLELIDIPSESRDEAALAAHVAGVLRDGGAEVRDLGDSCVLARPRGTRRRCCSPGTSTRCRRRTTSRARATTSASTGSAPAT